MKLDKPWKRGLIVGGAMTGTYFAVRKSQLTPVQKGGVVLGTGILSFLIVRTIHSYQDDVLEAPVDYGQIPYVYDSAGNAVKWDPDPLAQEFERNFEGYNVFTHPETTLKIRGLNDDQVRLLYNHYNKYYAKDFPTLTQLIENEWGDYSGSYAAAVSRLKKLGLT